MVAGSVKGDCVAREHFHMPGIQGNRLPTLKNLIQFVFGDPFLPKGNTMKISFQGAHFPDADSCFGILHFPCDHVNYSSFKRAMNNCINCQFVG